MSQPTANLGQAAFDAARAKDIRRKAGRFRILIIGRANAGKTTILKKVCNTTEEPHIYNSRGMEIDLDVVRPTDERGLHDIDNEMIFLSNPGFIFHDSRGFEAGNTTELKHVKDFISRRANQRKLKNQVHAIWYCIPMDNNRPVTKAEDTFFEECGTGHVPVIVVFTKLDALDDQAFGTLKQEKPDITHAEALMQAPLRAQQDFEARHPNLRIFKSRYPPKDHVYLRDMNLPTTDCIQLLERTAAAIDNDVLQMLFVSTQQSSLKLCTQYAIGKILARTQGLDPAHKLTLKEIQSSILRWYPHILDDLLRQDEDKLDDDLEDPRNLRKLRRLLRDELELRRRDEPWQDLRLQTIHDTLSMQEKVMSLIGYSNPSGHGIAQVAASLAIVAEHSFFLKQQNPTISFKDSVERALDDYLHSPQYSATMLAVQVLDITQDRTSSTSSIRSFFQSKKTVDEVSLQILHRKLTQIVQENHLTQQHT